MSAHPDFEALSAYHDGEAPELADHVGACEACRAKLVRLGAVSGTVAAPIEPMGAEAVDSMISRALAPDDQTAVVGTRVVSIADRSRNRWAVLASAAAAVVVALGLVGYLIQAGDGRAGKAQIASPLASTIDKRAAAPAPGVTGVTGDSPIDGGNLGEVADGRALVLKIGPAVSGQSAAAAADNPVVAPPGQAGSAQGPREVGTRACELQARSIDPGAGALVYVASATQGGTPATVLGFAPSGGGSPLSLFLMAQDGCGLLARATIP